MPDGIRTPDLPLDTELDEVIGHKITGGERITRRVPIADFVTQILDTGDLSGLSRNIVYAADFGVVADTGADQTAAMNLAVAHMNANPYTALYMPAGTVNISALNPFTGTGCVIVGVEGSRDTTLIRHSGDNAFTWENASSYGGLYNLGVDNTGPSTNTTINLTRATFQQFRNLFVGTGIGTLCKVGTPAVSTATGASSEVRFENLWGVVANVAVPLFYVYNGNNFHLNGGQFYVSAVPGATVEGRDLVRVAIEYPAAVDTLYMTDNDTAAFDHALNVTVSGASATALGPLFVYDNLFDSTLRSCIAINIAADMYIGTAVFAGNWFSSMTEWGIAAVGDGLLRSILIDGNVVDQAGLGAFDIAMTGPVRGLIISDNLCYSLNTEQSAGSVGIAVVGDSTYQDIIVANNIVNTAHYVTGTGQFVTDYGIVVSGACDAVLIEGNMARGNTDNYSLSTTMTNSKVVNNVGLPAAVKAITEPASGSPYTAGSRPETVFLRGGTITSIDVNGVVGALGAVTEVSIFLGPNQTLTWNGSVAPTMTAVVH